MYAGMCSVGVVAGWLAEVHKHYDQFRERSEEGQLAGYSGRHTRYNQMSQSFPLHPNSLGKTKGETCARSPMTRATARIWRGHAEG